MAIYAVYTFVLPKEITAIYDAENLTTQELVVQNQIEKDRLSQLPTTTKYFVTGKPLYEYRNGNYTTNLPVWYQDGKILLNTAEKTVVAEAKLVANTFWFDDKKEIPIGIRNELASELGKSVFQGSTLGLVFTLVLLFSVRMAMLMYSILVIGSVVSLLVSASGYWLLIFFVTATFISIFVFTSIKLTQKYWSRGNTKGQEVPVM
jgi:hypothetical protein